MSLAALLAVPRDMPPEADESYLGCKVRLKDNFDVLSAWVHAEGTIISVSSPFAYRVKFLASQEGTSLTPGEEVTYHIESRLLELL